MIETFLTMNGSTDTVMESRLDLAIFPRVVAEQSKSQ
jgi:hypothetical protein